MTSKKLKKEGRGSSDCEVAEEEDVVIVRFPVNMISTFVGEGNLTKLKGWCESLKEHVEIDFLEVIVKYNQFMRGLSKLVSLMALYPLSMRTRNWPVRVISHFIAFAVCNC